MVVGDLQVVLRRDRLRVANPLTHDVHGELLGEFRLPSASEVLEELGPGLQTGPLDDPKQLSPQVGIRVAVDTVRGGEWYDRE